MSTASSVPADSSQPAPPSAWLLYAKLVLVAAIWGGTFVAGRLVSQSIPHFSAGAARFLVAALALLCVTWRQYGGLPSLSREQLWLTLGLGLSGIFFYNACFFAALALLPASRTALLVALNPVATALIAALFLGQRLSWLRWLGIAVALLGAAIVVSRGELSLHLFAAAGRGELIMGAAVLSWALYTVLGQRALRSLSPMVATTYASLWGVLFLVLASIPEWRQIHWAQLGWPTLAAVGYLGLFGTAVGFTWYYQGVQRLGPARAAIFTNLVPVFGVLFGMLLLGEALLPSMLVGGAVVIAGVMLTNRRS
jgi:drug/metabolite transporter (DMT)-like permease